MAIASSITFGTTSKVENKFVEIAMELKEANTELEREVSCRNLEIDTIKNDLENYKNEVNKKIKDISEEKNKLENISRKYFIGKVIISILLIIIFNFIGFNFLFVRLTSEHNKVLIIVLYQIISLCISLIVPIKKHATWLLGTAVIFLLPILHQIFI